MTGGTGVRRGDVIVAQPSDGRGGLIRKRRPYVVVSPNELNDVSTTLVAAPLTTGHHPYRFRVPCEVLGRRGFVVLDQLYTVNAAEAAGPFARLSAAPMRTVLATLREMFEE